MIVMPLVPAATVKRYGIHAVRRQTSRGDGRNTLHGLTSRCAARSYGAARRRCRARCCSGDDHDLVLDPIHAGLRPAVTVLRDSFEHAHDLTVAAEEELLLLDPSSMELR